MTEEEQAPPLPETAAGAPRPYSGIAPEVSRRVASILDAVEREAARLREESRSEAGRYLDHARRHADGLVAERQRRIAELSDELIAKSEAVVARLDDAAPVRRGFENLVRALGDAAERLSQETQSSSQDFGPPRFHDAPGPPPQPFPSPAPAYRQPPPGEQRFDPFPPQPHPARAPSVPGWQAPAPAAATPVSHGPAAPPRTTSWQELDDARMIAIQLAASGSTRAAVREHLQFALGITESAGILDEVFGSGSGEAASVPWASGQR